MISCKKFVHLALAAGVAWCGYIVFSAIGFPVPALTGAAAAVAVAALLGLDADLPPPLRDVCILILGINIGTAVTPEVLETAIHWPASLAIMTGVVVAIMIVTRFVLMRFFGMDRLDATLASAPGHLSYVLSIATESNRDVSAIAIIQTIRVLFLTLVLPPVIQNVFGASQLVYLSETITPLPHLVMTTIIAVPFAYLFKHMNVPAAWLVAGMVISALGHGLDITPGRLPDSVGKFALIVMGTLIGSRFSAQPVGRIIGLIIPGLVVTVCTLAIAMIGALICVIWLGVSPALVTVAFAPGGVEAMAAIALVLGYDPAFVAAHHVFRLFLLSFLMPYVVVRSTRVTKH